MKLLQHPVIRNLIFFGFHLTPLLALLSGVSWGALIAMFIGYFTFMWGVTAGYHRYFSHRSFSTSRPFQFILALIGTLSLQKGVLHWAANHRIHHAKSDKDGDPHSPVVNSFWWSHVGWIMSDDWVETRWERIKDFAKYPELVWLNSYWPVPFIILCALVLGIFGFQYLVWGCFIPIVLTWHATFAVNSLLHVWGKRRYPSSDQSRNNVWLCIPTLGEGWHSNHHYYAASARQGFVWWEIDIAYYTLCLAEKLGIIWDVKRPPQKVLDARIHD